jgi:ribosomal-protein-alanine N-acetyltransferase
MGKRRSEAKSSEQAAVSGSPAGAPEIVLRPFQAEDLEALHQIDQHCFPPGIAYSRDELAAFITHPGACTWVAQAGAEIVGFLVADRSPHRTGHVVTIDVVEAWRRRGVGTLLMKVAEQWARKQGLRLMYLETPEDNRTAQAFYRRLGYQYYRTVERYYGNGASAWVMVKWLRPDGRLEMSDG